MSRAHPGRSEAYKAKKEKRELRTYNRELLRRAQRAYRARFGMIPKDPKIRSTIERIKTELKENDSQ